MGKTLSITMRTSCAAIAVFSAGCMMDSSVDGTAVAVIPPQSLSGVEWKEGFEEKDPVEFWTTHSKYEVDFKGLTEEMSASGKKSFKLDVTFKEGGYFYWHIPLALPAEGRLRFSGKMLLGKETTGTAGLGVNITLPPTQHSGCCECKRLKSTDGKWLTVEGDVVAWAAEKAANTPNAVAFIDGNDIGRMIDRIGIYLRGDAGQRVVLYVDDLRLEGAVPAKDAYDGIVVRRWAAAQARMASWFDEKRKVAQGIRAQLAEMAGAHESVIRFKQVMEKTLTGVEAAMDKDAQRESRSREDLTDIAQQLKDLAFSTASLKASQQKGIETNGVIVFALENPIIRTPILPGDDYVPGRAGADDLQISAAKGEYESASVVVRAVKDVKGLSIACGMLHREGGAEIILPDEVDIRVVKCWYQAGSAWRGISQDRTKRKLVPELLLKDDAVVRVDQGAEKNYLRLWQPDGAREVCVSDPDGEKKNIHSVEERPFYDSRHLKPLDLKAFSNKQYWITARVPPYAKEGVYTGELSIRGNDAELRKLVLHLRVLPFSLPTPKTCYDASREFISSVYYRGKLGAPKRKDRPGEPVTTHPMESSISSEWKNEEQLRAELRNMFIHNIINPTSCQQLEGLGEVLRIRDELGMSGRPLFSLGVTTGNPKDEVGLKELQRRVREVREAAAPYGIDEVYVYGVDEAKDEALLVQREAWKAVHAAGGKVFVAGAKGNVEKVGDLLDLQVQAGATSVDEARKWHAAGHRVFSYANPQTGPENPELFRRNFGLALWKDEYDGAMTYAYQHSYCDIYNDFDDNTYRDHVFSYPTVDGVIPTLAIEGYREAIDDIRYGTLLKQLAAKLKDNGGVARKLAGQAEEYFDTLDMERDAADIRSDMIDLILKLMREDACR